MTHQEWIEKILNPYVVKNSPARSEVQHILDFLAHNPNYKLSVRQTYEAVKLKSEKWTEKLNQKNKNLKEAGQVEEIHAFTDGMRFVRLLDQTAKNWEGLHMRHCVSSYSNNEGIYSLRDEENIPHCTIEYQEGYLRQIKGKANGKVSSKYHDYIVEAIKKLTSDLYCQDLEKIGYKAIEESLKYRLEKYFSGFKFVEGRSGSKTKILVYTRSKIKQINPIKFYSQDILELICENPTAPFSVFKELLELKPPPRYDIFLFRILADEGKTQWIKYYLEVIAPEYIAFENLSQILQKIVAGDNSTVDAIAAALDLVKAKCSILKEQPYKIIIFDPYQEAMAEAFRSNKKLKIIELLIKEGAKISLNQIPYLVEKVCKEKDESLLREILKLKELNVPYQCSVFIPELLSDGREDLVNLILEHSEPTGLFIVNYYRIWAHTLSPEVWKFFYDRFGFSEEIKVEFIRRLMNNKSSIKTPKTAVLDFLIKQGIDLSFNNGELLVTALTPGTRDSSVAFLLLRNGFLECTNFDSVDDESLKKLAKGFKDNTNSELGQAFFNKMLKLKRKELIAYLSSIGFKTVETLKNELKNFLELPLKEQILIYNKNKRKEWFAEIVKQGPFADPETGVVYPNYAKYLKAKQKELGFSLLNPEVRN